MGARGPKPAVELADYIPPNRHQALVLKMKLREIGTGRLQTIAILDTLDMLRRTGEDGVSQPTRSNYCQQLAKIGEPPWRRRLVGVNADGSTELSDLSAGHPSRRSTAALAELPAAA